MAFKVIQGHRGRYQSKAYMRFAISDALKCQESHLASVKYTRKRLAAGAADPTGEAYSTPHTPY